MQRLFWIVADSLGVGAAPDAAAYGDEGADTLRTLVERGALHAPFLQRLGLMTASRGTGDFACVCGKAAERSGGKDTVTGHWEMCGVITPRPFPTFPNGFPAAVTDPFCRTIGRGILCNRPYSGTQVLRDYGQEHLRTGQPIVYTSADSVFQIAAHTDVASEETLYEWCRTARGLLQGEYAVGRVIARPFDGAFPFRRTSGRHDFPLPPPRTVLDCLAESGLDVLAVGKIGDIFSMHGITEHFPTANNREGMDALQSLLERDFHGLCFVNLVDFDMLYGHRRDADGYARALETLDAFLADFTLHMSETDALLLTGDHGCDPGYTGTDHTREYVPILLYGKAIPPRYIGVRDTFADMGATVASLLGASWDGDGTAIDIE